MFRYPVLSRSSVIDCPVHGFTVALGPDGRIVSRCPGCILEARRVRRRWAQRRRRVRAVA